MRPPADDTDPDARARQRAILLARSPAERLAMAGRMAVGARALIEAGVRAELGAAATEADVRRAVFLRFYARNLGRDRAAQIANAIEARRRARDRT